VSLFVLSPEIGDRDEVEAATGRKSPEKCEEVKRKFNCFFFNCTNIVYNNCKMYYYI
jgi:hypothetical protein